MPKKLVVFLFLLVTAFTLCACVQEGAPSESPESGASGTTTQGGFQTENAANTAVAGDSQMGNTADTSDSSESGTAVESEVEQNSSSDSEKTSAQEAPVSFPYTFTDSTGQTITLEQRPTNVAVLFSSYADIWVTSGGNVNITVGDSIDRGFCPEGTLLVDSGAGLKIDTELLVSYEPDFVIGSADMAAQYEACQQLTGMGIPCAAFTVETFDDYLQMLKICTDITGNSQAYETAGLAVQEEITSLLADLDAYLQSETTEPTNVLFIRAGSSDSSTKAKTAKDHFVGVMLDELGTVNIADAAGDLSEGLSLESIVLNQPDVILIVTQGSEDAAISYVEDLFGKSGWRDLQAVAQDRYYFLPKDLFHYKPNARWAESYAYLMDLIYPGFQHA